MTQRFEGIYCAAVTPMHGEEVDTDLLMLHLESLASEGCDGVLLMGTTGEGPSLSLAEREIILSAAVSANSGLKLLAGTGTPSLPETIQATMRAFDLGADAVVVVPPYFFRNASVEGLRAFYGAVIEKSVPTDGAIIIYHIPPVSGVPIPKALLAGLVDDYGDRVAGLKDSGGDLSYSRDLIADLPSLEVFVGSERLLLEGLKAGAAGCITAGANVLAPLCVDVYRAWRAGQPAEALQERLSALRVLIEAVAPAPATYKSLLRWRHGGRGWDVRPPLLNHSVQTIEALIDRIRALDPAAVPWLEMPA